MRLKHLYLILPILLLIAHLAFITSDADGALSESRGPYTDEGLYAAQTRDWVDFGDLNIDSYDALVKAPLFGFSLAFFFKLFGTKLIIARLFVLLSSLFCLSLFLKNKRYSLIFALAIPIVYLQFHVFEFMHLALSEIVSINCLLLGFYFFVKGAEGPPKIVPLGLACFFVALSYYMKIQFAYLIVLLPTVSFLIALQDYFSWSNFQGFRIFLITLGFSLFFLFLYYIFWYLPNQELFDYVMSQQSDRIPSMRALLGTIRFNFNHHFQKTSILPYTIFAIPAALFSFYYLVKKQDRRLLFHSLVFVWFLLELHKVSFSYLPSRYLVSLIFAAGLLIAISLHTILAFFGLNNRLIVFVFFLAIGAFQFPGIVNRSISYQQQTINKYLAKTLQKGDVVLGPWAASSTWQTKAKAIPVWSPYFNHEKTLETFKPRLIISEPKEEESSGAYRKQGINLAAISDSTRHFPVKKYELIFYWISD